MKQKTTLGILSLLLFCNHVFFAQNLITNPGFEEIQECDNCEKTLSFNLLDVSSPTSSSTDYFHSHLAKDNSAPNNFKGVQEPMEGNGYVGAYMYAMNDYREYLQLNTTKTLREKHPYKIRFKVSLAETSKLALKNLSIVLVNKKLNIPNSKVLTSSRLDLVEGLQFHEVAVTADKSMSDTEEWITLTAEFEAKGFENHILIGNFNSNIDTKLIKAPEQISTSDFAYYFIDDFDMEELPRINYEKDKIYVMERNPFEPKGYELDRAARASAEKIFKYLKENAEVQMKITGHSDGLGSPEYNKFISSLRARAVALYLKKMGISDDRIVWEGIGDTKPLGNGNVKSGGIANSRVEFVMTDYQEK
ncbi:OmpA family protein [Croceivirga thetidis]|uniref:OmpA family protein n=1 Tax=Croceivirga thetidis TaxID=2721623 RepID=A0ABX1GVQ4_9FLAO|nr:OmpA family protein [Croceivirga thetidis]NKI33116.1 OmpA family protein [Croceivirga thetidis]